AAATVDALSLAVEVVDDGALRRVGHPDLVGGIAGGLEAGHAEEIIDAQIIHARAVDAGHDGGPRLIGDAVQRALLVVGSPGAFADAGQRLLRFGAHRWPPAAWSGITKSQTARAANIGSSLLTISMWKGWS